MKKYIAMMIICLGLTNAFAQTKTDTIPVAGNCEHCKERIEGTVSTLKGVKTTLWDGDHHWLIVAYQADEVSNMQIQQRIAAAGHDTREVRASDKAYKSLPACCKYERAPLKTEEKGTVRTMHMKITGMTCAEGCAKGIESALFKQKGVKLSEVNYATQQAKVVYDSAKISREQLIAIIEHFKPDGEKDMKYHVQVID
jgi:mercuric ion binding protein